MKFFLPFFFFLLCSIVLQGQVIQASGPTSFCAGGSVTLTVSSTSGITGYQWINSGTNVGTGALSFNANVSGSYSVKLTRTGLPDTTIGPLAVTVNPLPVANFTFNTSIQCSNIPVAFTNTSTGGDTYAWNFGDVNSGSNNTSSSSNPIHTFIGTPGDLTQTFNIVQTVKTVSGCIDTKTLTITTKQLADGTLGGTGKASYNGSTYFKTCGQGNGDFTFTNQTVTQGTNKNYQIIWGDGSPDYTALTFSSTTHTYTVGNHPFLLIITGNNGCVDTTKYTAFVGTNPAVGLNNPGNTLACSGTSLTFPITGVSTNAPGTIYSITFNDGTLPISYVHPDIPSSITHIFDVTSCGTTSSVGANTYSNSFYANIVAVNPCNSSAATVVPIYISKKPIAAFNISPKDTTCVNTLITFTDASENNFVDNGKCLKGNSIWSVSPATGWTISSGNLGNDFGLTDPSVWQSGSLNLTLNFNTPGVYTIKIKTGNTNCGVDEITKNVCITTAPTPGFNLNNLTGCTPFNVSATNITTSVNSCTPPTYLWSVAYTPAFCGTISSWAFASGNATSASPSFTFNNPGTYTIKLAVTNACGTYEVSKTVDVKKPPAATITIPAYPCGPVNITPAAATTNCGTAALTYLWTFDAGTPATSTSADPGPVNFTAVGTHNITLAVTNECGTTTANSSVIVSVAPDVVVPANQNYCGGQTTGPLNFSSTVGTPVYNWTNSNPAIGLAANGSGNIPSFTVINNGVLPITATITVSPFISAQCSGIPVSFTITVNPRPVAPSVISPVVYCLNAVAAPLEATAVSGNLLTWYNNVSLTGGTTAAPVPSTTNPGSTTYYVTQSNSFNCASPAGVITVRVSAAITGNTISGDQNICANTVPAALNGTGNVSGGTGGFIYQWQSSIDGGTTWTNINAANGTSYSPNALSATRQYRRIVNSTPCSDTSNIVTITVQGALGNYNIASSQIICEGFAPDSLKGDLPTGGGGSYTYLWESSIDNINWNSTGNSNQDYQPLALLQTTYFRRQTIASQCKAVSPVLIITVNPTPVGSISSTSSSICEYDAAGVSFNATKGTAPFNIELTVTRPNGTDTTILQTINNNGPANINVIQANSATGNYVITLKKITDGKGCINTSASISEVTINVKPRPVLILSTPPTICNGTSALLTASGATEYLWTPNTGLSKTTGDSITANPVSTTTYTVTGKLNNCFASTAITVTVTPGTTKANAGPDQILCNAANATLAANNPVTGLGSWLQTSGPSVNFADASLPNTIVTGLVRGQRYVFKWTITGLPPCPPTVSAVTIDVLSPIMNTIKKDTVICNGQSVLLQTEILSGGNTDSLNAQYTYQWESTPSGQTNWQIITGETKETLNISPSVSTCYRRKVKSNNFCEETSNVVCITVNPTIGNNIIGVTQQEVCVNSMPANLTGAIPTGGDNNYIYQWQTSTDAINWADVATSLNYQPAAYLFAGRHYFRRNVTSGNCISASNIITISVRPDSKAIFSANPLVACAPFNLSTAIIVTPLPDSNGTYQWYANGLLTGTSLSGAFPGYTILNPADTVIIKLKTTSQYGCKPDSIEQQFITVATAVARFTKDASSGCGPLAVNFTNTSSLINSGIQFFWDFGNGTKNTLAQPGTIVFNSSPFFNDTTYQVSLKAYNGCDTTIWRDSVKVRANPKARFGVDTTFGCSPFTIQISNTSPGGANTYYWDFGNGVRDTTFTNGVFNYTYNIGNAVDTFTIRLIAENQCARDTQSINIRIAPNIIRPLINVNSSQLFGCAPHIVSFSNNSSGATAYTWNFGDNTSPVVTNNNQTNIVHTYANAGVFTVSVDITNGCSDTTVYRQVTVYAKPTAAFTTNAAIYCEGDTVRVNNTSTNATNYRWFWGDGATDGGLNPVHVFPVAGSYNILLHAVRSNASGTVCLDTLAIPVIVLAKPVVSVQSNINTINCAPFTLNISATGVINENVTWYFYDSTVNPNITTSNNISAQHTFNKPGSFYVKLVAVNAQGCKDSTIVRFTVRGKAVASIWPANLSVCTRDTTVNYLNTSTYNGTDPISYRWLVDNALVSTGANFTYRYNVLPAAILPRVYTTSLIVSNTVGCSDTAIATLQMNPPAKAQFSISNPNDCVPVKLQVTDASTYTASYRWLLNGILVDTAAIPAIVITRGSTLYQVSLIADNLYGCKPDTFSVSFTSRARPVAAFKLSDTLGCTGVLNVGTTNLTTGASGYIWNWGDATANSTFSNPTHLYSTQGQFLITLVASDGICTDTTSQLVKVSTKPVADFSVDQTITCDTARVQFTNLTTNAASYTWSFGDGSFSNATNPSKSYPPRTAPYTVSLVAYSNFGCKDSLVKANLVLAKIPPAGDFFISPNPVITVPNYTFNFNNLTLNSTNYQYLWSLGDGSFATSYNVSHKYTDTGNYSVQLIVLDTLSNCPDTTVKIARIDGFPGYLYVPNAMCPSCIQSNIREFIPKGMGLKEYRLQIFTTWNELVFETRALDSKGSPTQAWDGKFKGTLVQQDVYVWRIDAKFLNGSEWLGMIYPGDGKYKKVGTITVIK